MYGGRLYTEAECRAVGRECGVPVLFDVFHHECNPSSLGTGAAVAACAATWKEKDGVPMVDYSSQEPGERRGRHARTLDPTHFATFLAAARPHDPDIMLEIKDKEQSALRALEIAREGDLS